MQMGARPCDPALGQFLEEDPVLGAKGFGQSANRYAYVWNNPLNRYDLTGLFLDGLIPDRICTPNITVIRGCVGEEGVEACVGVPTVAEACADEEDALNAARNLDDFVKDAYPTVVGCAIGAATAAEVAAPVPAPPPIYVIKEGAWAIAGCVAGGAGGAAAGSSGLPIPPQQRPK